MRVKIFNNMVQSVLGTLLSAFISTDTSIQLTTFTRSDRDWIYWTKIAFLASSLVSVMRNINIVLLREGIQ